MVRILPLVALAVLGACSPAVTVGTPPPPPPKTAVKVPRPAESPARWLVTAGGTLTFDVRLDLGPAGVLYVSDGGERWLEKKGAVAVAAPTLLVSDIRGVTRSLGGRYVFVAGSGAVFETDEPLGPVKAKRAAPKGLRLATSGKAAIVAIDASGAIVRSTDGGASWAPANAPKITGLVGSVAMHGNGLGLALAAPQQVLATDDDGASWKSVGTPGLGAHRVAVEVNGELVLDGVVGGAVLKSGPLRLEKSASMARIGYDLALPESAIQLELADAMRAGRGLLLEDRYLELGTDPDGDSRYRLFTVELGPKSSGFVPKVRRVPELDGCSSVMLGGHDEQVEFGCSRHPDENNPQPKWGKPGGWNPSPSYRPTIHLWKSTDRGEKLAPDGMIAGAEREQLLWVSPDGTLLLDGACKRTHGSDWICDDSPPVVRLAGAKTVAKAVSAQGTRFQTVVYGKQHAYALGTNLNGMTTLYVSKNLGKDFARRGLPAVATKDESDPIAFDGSGGIVAVEESFVAVYMPSLRGLLRYVSTDDGVTFKGSVVPLPRALYVGAVGKRALAYDGAGVAWESADGGESWTEVSSMPTILSVSSMERPLVCNPWACIVGNRGARVGWDIASGASGPIKALPTPAEPKRVARTGIECTAEGEWQSEGNLTLPAAGNADLGGGTRWVLAKRDHKTSAITAVVQKTDAKGALEHKEIVLFGPDKSPDVATVGVMQVEGVAALKYSFKREKAAVKVTGSPVMPPVMGKSILKPAPPPPPPPGPPIVAKQTVDVEVAWYLAATGKVLRGTIKGVGPLDPVRDVIDGRLEPSSARTFLLSIAPGGIHVRPLASATPDAPLYFVTDAGKVEKFTWPDVPNKDARGKIMSMHFDATRVGKRSVVFADSWPAQFFVAWSNEAGGAWESRFWSLWPDTDLSGGAFYRFLDSGDGSGAALGLIYPGSATHPPAAFGFVVKSNIEDDPAGLFKLPVQHTLADPPPVCTTPGKDALRVNVPYSTGTRHPVIVKGEGLDRVFATSNAVVRVGPNGAGVPCVSALDATPVPQVGDSYSALIPPADLEHATLFRNRYEAGSLRLHSRNLKCSYQKTMKLPDALAHVSGFTED